MTLPRNTPLRRSEEALGIRPLTARSVLLSTLLGLDPPVLPAHRLVATAGLFGIAEGTARVALSRMAAAGEVVADGGRYRLADRFLGRQRRQAVGRHPATEPWTGEWHVFVVAPGRRPARDRATARAALRLARMGEWREGLWARPTNLPRPDDVGSDGTWLLARPDTDEPSLAAALWDLDGWAARSRLLLDHLDRTPVDGTEALAPGFVLSAAILRHLGADPLLPEELLPAAWPGTELRRTYDDWDRRYQDVLADWHRLSATERADSAT